MEERERILEVAKGQRTLLRVIGLFLVSSAALMMSLNASLDWVTFVAIPTTLGLLVLAEVANVALQVRARTYWVALVLTLALSAMVIWFCFVVSGPVLGIFTAILLILFDCASVNGRVTKKLRGAGVRVRFLGVRKEELARMQSGVCFFCGYDMAGLPSPVCPECGKESRIAGHA